MELKNTEIQSKAIRLSVEDNGQEVGRIFLYLIKNDLHETPYGLFEDIFVEESHRSQGVGKQLVAALIEEAKKQGCYKIVACARYSRPEVHAWYERIGFKDYGKEFRLDL